MIDGHHDNDVNEKNHTDCNDVVLGKRHGHGEYKYNDGSKYIGNWENDIIKGEGTRWCY